jgi:exosortase E/protease (VPEID-CTERM system)
VRVAIGLAAGAEALWLRDHVNFGALVAAGLAEPSGRLASLRHLLLGGTTGVVLATLAMVVVASGPRERAALARWGRDLAAARVSLRWLVVHALLALPAFYCIATFAAAPASLALLILGGILAALAFACWLPALLPLDGWRAHAGALARLGGTAALAGLVAGALGLVSQRDLWDPLSRPTLAAVRAILGALSLPVVVGPAAQRIALPHFAVRIDAACAGYEGIGILIGVMAVYLRAWRHALRFPQALALLFIGPALAWLTNPFRIAALLLVGELWSPKLALSGFHSNVGWLLAVATSFVALWIARRLGFIWREDARRSANQSFPAAPFLAPLLLTMLAILAEKTVETGFESFYALRVVVALTALWWWRRAYAGLPRDLSWAAPAVGVAVFCLWIIPAASPESSAAGADLKAALAGMAPLQALAWTVLRVIGATITVPVVEELAFRGFLYRFLIDRDFTAVSFQRWSPFALVASSLAFGLMHQQRLLGAVAGLAYGWVMVRRGRLVDAIVAHAVTNGLLAAYVLITGDYSQWC